jgi:hypothetical protein
VREDVGELFEPVVLSFEHPLVLFLLGFVVRDDGVAIEAAVGQW